LTRLTKADILRLLELLEAELDAKDVEAELYLLGGAVMCVAFDAREATRDVDALFEPTRVVREAAARVAAKARVPDSWLNDAVKGYLSPQGEFDSFLELAHLKVFVPRPEYLLAMKCAAMRLGEEFHDLDDVRYLLSFLPSNNLEEPPQVATTDDPHRLCPELRDIIPASSNQPYDMAKVIEAVVDDGEFFEVHEQWAPNIVVGFARLDGHAVGVIANQPSALAGTLDIDASVKGARFVRFCDAFNIPLVTFEDVPGFLPGIAQEHGGIIKHGAKLLYAYCEATVPKLTVILRKAYGGAYDVMSSKHIRGDLNLAWPTAEIAVMGPKGAVEILWRREIEESDDPEAAIEARAVEYRKRFANPYVAAERGYVDAVIDPAETRWRLVNGLHALAGKRDANPPRKHGNLPL
jgi:acetyl-CoA carboxylase carboxyltransferase component